MFVEVGDGVESGCWNEAQRCERDISEDGSNEDERDRAICMHVQRAAMPPCLYKHRTPAALALEPGPCTCWMTFNLSRGAVAVLETIPAKAPETNTVPC